MRRPGMWCHQAALVASLVGAFSAAAQRPSLTDVRPGDRVRLIMRDSLRQEPVLPTRQTMVGQFVRATSDSVWLRPAGASEVSVARPEIRRASVSRGASRLRSAFTFGASVGFAFAAAIAIDQIDHDSNNRARDALLAGGVGFGGGMLIGALSPYEHWRDLRR